MTADDDSQTSATEAEESNRKVDETIKSQRCAISAPTYNSIQILATNAKKTNCEVQEELLKYAVNRAQKRAECKDMKDKGLPLDDSCKCSEY